MTLSFGFPEGWTAEQQLAYAQAIYSLVPSAGGKFMAVQIGKVYEPDRLRDFSQKTVYSFTVRLSDDLTISHLT